MSSKIIPNPSKVDLETDSLFGRTFYIENYQKCVQNDTFFSNNFNFLVLPVRIGSLMSVFFHILVILVTNGTEFNTLARKFMKNLMNY